MLAGYLVFQLRRALGRRSDNQEPKSKPTPEQRAEHSETDNVVAIKPNEYKNFEITDKFIELLENQIKSKPEYYTWTHKRFKHRKTLTN